MLFLVLPVNDRDDRYDLHVVLFHRLDKLVTVDVVFVRDEQERVVEFVRLAFGQELVDVDVPLGEDARDLCDLTGAVVDFQVDVECGVVLLHLGERTDAGVLHGVVALERGE